jgi:hypothetical protein
VQGAFSDAVVGTSTESNTQLITINQNQKVNIMALNLVTLGYQYFPDPTRGRPVFNGSIYVGEPDTDPEIPGNQKAVTLIQEDGTQVPVSQPVETGPGGVPLYNGSPVQITVDGNYSLKVLNTLGVQVFYLANAFSGAPITTETGTGFYVAYFSTNTAMAAEDLPVNAVCRLSSINNVPVDALFTISNSDDTARYSFALSNGRYAILNGRCRIYGAGASVATATAALMNQLTLQGSPITLADNAPIFVNDTVLIYTGTSIEGDSTNAVLTLAASSNVDVLKTWNFDSLTGVGPLVDGPTNFVLRYFQIDGNYLADWRAWVLGADTTVNNSAGNGVTIFGSKYKIDLEINNVAQTAFYSEAVDYTGYTDEQACYLAITGRVTGKDCIVFRGPADIEIGVIFYGVPGANAIQAIYDSVLVMSDYYPTEEVAVFVADEQREANGYPVTYAGHHEFNTMHLYGNVSGYSYRALNTGRVKGNHMICENCRGGAYLSQRMWGGFAMLECHNNGRLPPSLGGSPTVLPDIYNESGQGFQLNATIRRSKQEQDTYLSYYGSETNENTIARIAYFSLDDSGTGEAPIGNVVHLQGPNNDIHLNGRNINGDAILVESPNNNIDVNCSDVYNGSVVRRYSGDSFENTANRFNIRANDCENVFYVDGLVTPEEIRIVARLNAGQTLFDGDALDLVTRAVGLDIYGRIDNDIRSSRRHGTENLDNSVTTEQTITFDHNFFTTPSPDNVKYGLYDPGASYAGSMDYIYLREVTATQLTFVYKLGATGTGGPLVLLWSVEV